MQSSDGMHYAPKGKPAPVVKPGEFVFAAVGLDHGHIGGMCNGLMEAGATLKWILRSRPRQGGAVLQNVSPGQGGPLRGGGAGGPGGAAGGGRLRDQPAPAPWACG